MTTEQSQQTPSVRSESLTVNSRFHGKVVVITGPSLHGIGGAIANRVAEEGASIAMLSDEKPDDLIERLKTRTTNVYWTACDVTDGDGVEAATEACEREFGKVDILINNAGVQSAGPFMEMDEQKWRRIVEVNLLGVLHMSQAMLPHLQKGKGVIVNISSCTAFAGTAGLAVYGASKAGLNGLTESLAVEYAERGVRVVGVAPALVRTPMIAPYVENVTSEDWEAIQKCHPLGIGLPEDVASAVAFLASDEARWISGVTLPLGWMPIWPMPFLKS